MVLHADGRLQGSDYGAVVQSLASGRNECDV